eukprot:g23300.t1
MVFVPLPVELDENEDEAVLEATRQLSQYCAKARQRSSTTTPHEADLRALLQQRVSTLAEELLRQELELQELRRTSSAMPPEVDENALLAQRGAEICEEAAKLSAERGSLEEVQKQKEEEVQRLQAERDALSAQVDSAAQAEATARGVQESALKALDLERRQSQDEGKTEHDPSNSMHTYSILGFVEFIHCHLHFCKKEPPHLQDLAKALGTALQQRHAAAEEAERQLVTYEREVTHLEASSAAATAEAQESQGVREAEASRRRQLQQLYEEQKQQQKQLAEARAEARRLEAAAQRLARELAESEQKAEEGDRKAMAVAKELMETLDCAGPHRTSFDKCLQISKNHVTSSINAIVARLRIGRSVGGLRSELSDAARTGLEAAQKATGALQQRLAARGVGERSPLEEERALKEALRSAWENEASERRQTEEKLQKAEAFWRRLLEQWQSLALLARRCRKLGTLVFRTRGQEDGRGRLVPLPIPDDSMWEEDAPGAMKALIDFFEALFRRDEAIVNGHRVPSLQLGLERILDQALANVAYDHEEALDAFLLGIEKDPVRFEKMIGCYRAMAEVQFERQQRKELSLGEKRGVARCEQGETVHTCASQEMTSLQQPTIISSGEVYILNGSTGGELNPVPFFLNKNLRVLSANLDRAFVAVEPTLWTSPVEGALPPCSVYCFKADQSEPEYCPEFEVIKAPIRQIAFGSSHTLVLTDDGTLYSRGVAMYGSTGHGGARDVGIPSSPGGPGGPGGPIGVGGVNGAGGRPPQQPRPPRPQVKPSAWLKITRKSYFQVLAPSPPDFRALIKEALLKHDAGIQDAGSSGDDGDEGPENFEDVVHRFIYVKRTADGDCPLSSSEEATDAANARHCPQICPTCVPALSKGSAVRYASCTPKWAGVPQAYRLLAGAQKLERFKQQAATLVASYISLAEETLSDGELLERIKQSAAGYASPDPSAKTHVLIYYSQHDGGEATAQPHLRVPPLRLRGQHAQRFAQMGLLRRGAVEGPDLVPGDVFIMTGKEGNKMPLMNAFALPPETEKGKPIPIAKKTVRQLSLMLSEKTIAQKMEKVRGYSSINQMQPLYVVSKLSLNLNLHLGHGYNI